MNRKILSAVFVSIAAAAWTSAAYSQAKPETLVKQRQAAMTLQGKYFGPMSAMAQGKIPYNAGVVTRNAGYLEALSKMPWDGFNPNTKGEKTQALPAVFSEPAKFKQAQDHFEAEASKLAQLVKGGDEAAIKTQILAVNKACGACHDDFREKR